MASWNRAVKEGLLVGSVASVVSTLALAALRRRETGHAAAPANQLDLRHLLTGYLIHHATSVFWATLYSRVYGQRPQARSIARILPASAAASALACFTDYRLTPRRLQPGFEKGLSTPATVLVYGSFALGLAAGNLLLAERMQQATSGERRRASDRRLHARRASEVVPDRRRWRAGQPAMAGEAGAWPWPEGNPGGSGDGGAGESWSATVTSH